MAWVLPYPRSHVGSFRAILRRDPCAYRGGPGGTVDHIEPKSRGGVSYYTNLSGSCERCKSRRTGIRGPSLTRAAELRASGVDPFGE